MPKTEKPRATVKQKRAASKLVGNGGNVTKAMLDAGYSPNTANTPSKLTNSKGFQSLMNKVLNDDKVLKAHETLLSAVNIENYVFALAVTDADIRKMIAKIPGAKLLKIQRSSTAARAYFTHADNRSVKDGVDMAYKLKGSYAAEKQEHSVTPEIARIIEHMKSVLPAAK